MVWATWLIPVPPPCLSYTKHFRISENFLNNVQIIDWILVSQTSDWENGSILRLFTCWSHPTTAGKHVHFPIVDAWSTCQIRKARTKLLLPKWINQSMVFIIYWFAFTNCRVVTWRNFQKMMLLVSNSASVVDNQEYSICPWKTTGFI